MPAASAGSEPFARAAALYSQHLARPPSAYHPSSGSGRQGRRRPLSASAATGPTQRQLATSNPTSSASASPQTVARPVSAAVIGEESRRASRPSRPHPVVATGNAPDHQSGNAAHGWETSLTQHRRNHGGQQRCRSVACAGNERAASTLGPGITRPKGNIDTGASKYKRGRRAVGSATGENLVKGPAWEFNMRRDDGAESGSALEGYGRRDRVDEEPIAGAEFWHEHKPLAVDPTVMQKAEEFVARILHAKQEGDKQSDPSTSRPQADQCTPVGLKSPKAGKKTLRHGTTKRKGSAGIMNTRRVGQRLRRRGGGNMVGASTAAGKRSRGDSVPTIARPKLGAEVLDPGGQKVSHRPKATSMVPANSSELRLTPCGTALDLGNVVVEDDSHLVHDQPSPTVKEVSGDDGEGNSGHSSGQECCSLSLMTPLNFDVFCSMRPTLLTEACTKQGRQKTVAITGVAGLSKTGQGNTQQGNGNRSSQHVCQSHRGGEEARLLSTWRVPSTGGIGGNRPSYAWTSIFGAACAGAERGRAREEVLAAARRESLRQSKRRRRAAVASAAVLHAPVVSVDDAQTFSATIACPAETAVEKYCTLSSKTAAGTTGVERLSNEKPVAHGDGSCEGVLEDVVGGTHSLTPRTPNIRGVQSDHQSEMVDTNQAFDAKSIPSRPLDLSLEANTLLPDEVYSQSTPRSTPAQLIADHQMRHSHGTAMTTPLFRHPFGGGTTRIGVNAPRSLQVCPGERGFNGGTASQTPTRCFSSPRRQRVAHRQHPSAWRPRGPSVRRPSTASGDRFSSMIATCSMGGDASHGVQFSSLDVKAGSATRPETAGSFFSRRYSRRGKLVSTTRMIDTGKSNRDSLRSRWTDGECLRRRVDRILDSFSRKVEGGESARSHASSTWCQQQQQQEEEGGEEVAVEDQRDVDAADKLETHTTEAGLDASDDVVPEAGLAPRSAACMSGLLSSADACGSRNDAFFQPLVEFGVNDTAGGMVEEKSKQVDGEAAEASNSPDRPAASTVNAVLVTPVASNAMVFSSTDGNALSARPGLARLRLRPSSAPSRCPTHGGHPRSSRPRSIHGSDMCVVVVAQRSGSSPGLMQGTHHTVCDMSTAEIDNAGAGQLPCPPGLHAISGETNGDAGDGGVGRLDGHAGPSSTSSIVVEATASLYNGRDICDAVVHDRGEDGEIEQGGGIGGGAEKEAEGDTAKGDAAEGGGAEGRAGAGEGCNGDRRGNGGGDSASPKSNHDTGLESTDTGQAYVTPAVPEEQDVRLSRRHPTTGSARLVNLVVGRDEFNGNTRPESSSAPVPAGVETPLDFAKATVKLKMMAAETGVAVDGYEKAWEVSKEKAEVLFNDVRLSPEQDAQRSCDGAASETRRRLQRIMIESGVESSRRVKKEADLEEARRVLRQDTNMYAARRSASDRMREEVRSLEAENDSCDLLQLLEWRRSRSLSMLRERTERDKDGLRAACRRRREEAGAMSVTLAEARHAHGRLVGHVQHMVERLSCLAEYVRIMRGWCQEHLESRRHARVTSKIINREFGRKSEELDALLKEERVVQSAPDTAKGAPTKGEARQERNPRHFQPAVTTLNRNQDYTDNGIIASTTALITHTNPIKLASSDNNDDPYHSSANTNINAAPDSSPAPNPRDTNVKHIALSTHGDVSPPFAALLDTTSTLRRLLDVIAFKYRPQFYSPFHPLPEM